MLFGVSGSLSNPLSIAVLRIICRNASYERQEMMERMIEEMKIENRRAICIGNDVNQENEG